MFEESAHKSRELIMDKVMHGAFAAGSFAPILEIYGMGEIDLKSGTIGAKHLALTLFAMALPLNIIEFSRLSLA